MWKRRPQIVDFVAIAVVLLTLIACGGPAPAPAPAPRNDAQASRDAGYAAFGGTNPVQTQTTAQSSSAQQGFASLEKPVWVDMPETVYPRHSFISGVGNGITRDMAEKNALAALTGFFGQNIIADQTVTYAYMEAFKSGSAAEWIENSAIQSSVRTAATMDALIGAEIREVWHDTRANVFYAIALMDRARTIQTYSDLIVANQNMINNLIDMTPAEKNTLTGYSRIMFAAVTADMNVTYGNLLTTIGASSPIPLQNGTQHRLEAQRIAPSIPIGVIVRGDKANRIRGAFEKAISELGFRSGNASSPNIIDVDVVINPVNLANQNNNKFVRVEVSATLIEASTGTGMLPWNFADRQGHLSESEAENRAIAAAERKINAEYKDILQRYLAQLLPARS